MQLPQNTNKNNPAPRRKKWFGLTALFLLALVSIGLLAGIAAAFGLEIAFDGKFYSGISLDSYPVGGKTKAEVKTHFEEIQKTFDSQGVDFSAEGKKINLKPLVVAENQDLPKQIVSFDWDSVLDSAFALGRSNGRLQNFLEQIDLYLKGRQQPLNPIVDELELKNILKAEFAGLEEPTVNAGIEIDGEEIKLTEEKAGFVFDYDAAAAEFKNKVANLDFSEIRLNRLNSQPTIDRTQAQSALSEVQSIIDLAPIDLKYEKEVWTISQAQMKKLIEFQYFEDKIVVGLNREKVAAYFEDIAKEIDIEPKDARFEVKDGKVAEFQQSIDGKKLNLETSYAKLNQRVIDKNNTPVELDVELTQSATTMAGTNDLGISELIGRGESNFKGSPANRRVNIANGAKILNGILIKPDEEFSLLAALGPIDGEHGFKQELVIKGDRTIPEYGGGLCQIGTTAFRVALRSGLPITQRQNHSYRVTYYEPAGMDATIYDPQPDLKFINDTGKHILFTTRIEGDSLIFDFYGTKDGRKIEIAPDPPRIFNVKSPGESRYIETTELAPGEKKKLESRHAGADTYFKYTVTYPGGEVKEKEFKSHYVVWPEVWLVGVAATSTDGAAGTPAENPAEAPAN